MERGRLIVVSIVAIVWILALGYSFYTMFVMYRDIKNPTVSIGDISKIEINEAFSFLTISEDQFISGDSINVKRGDVIPFTLDKESYSIKLLSINLEEVELAINNFLLIKLNPNEFKKIDLNKDDIYDLKIEIISINENNAQISFKRLNEKKGVIEIMDTRLESALKEFEKSTKMQMNFIAFIFSIFIALFCFYMIKYHLMPSLKLKKMTEKESSSDAFEILYEEYLKAKRKARVGDIKRIYEKMRHLYDYMKPDDQKKFAKRIDDVRRSVL